MSLMRRLFPEMRQMMRQMDEAFSPLISSSYRARPRWGDFPMESAGFVPTADIYETSEKYIIETEMPGVNREDIKFELNDDKTIIVRGEVKKGMSNDSGGSEGQRSGERFFGLLERAFTIPTKIEPDQIQADFKNGLLTIEIPKKEGSRTPLEISWKQGANQIKSS